MSSLSHIFPVLPPLQKSGYFILTVHNDQNCYDEDEQLLKAHTLHTCDIHLHVEGLSTGYSQEVHGEVSYIHCFMMMMQLL